MYNYLILLQMHQLKTIKLSQSTHKSSTVIKLEFEYNEDLITLIKQNTQAHWSKTMNCWYILKRDFDVKSFKKLMVNKAELILESESKIDVPKPGKKVNKILANQSINTASPKAKIHQTGKAEIQSIVLPHGYIERLERKRYSENTINIYCSYMRSFMRYFSMNNIELDAITSDQINAYILSLIKIKRISASQQNQHINAIKFYYEKVLGRDKVYYSIIERPKKALQLPKVLSEAEIMRILKNAENLKHKAILSTIYSAGLRRSELIGLRKEDILFDKNIIFVRGAKGKKDRTTILSDSVAIVLKRYLKDNSPNYWLFEGPSRRQYSATSVAIILKQAAKRARINRNVTPHMLRHSFATHLLEQGVDIRYIQHILGHESSRTTEIYTHISKKSLAKIKSPLDTILRDN